MANSKEKTFRKLKRQYTWVSIVVFVISFLLLIAVVNAAVIFFTLYTIDSKIDDEYKIVEHMANIYEESLDVAKEDYREILQKAGTRYLVKDGSGNIIATQGRNTCSDVGGHTGFLFGKRPYVVYEDTEDNHLVYGSNGWVSLNLNLLGWTENEITVDAEEHPNPSTDEDKVLASGYVEMPIWIGTELSNGDTFIAMGHIRIRLSVIVILAIIMICLNAFLLVYMIVRIIRIVKGLRRRKQLTELFLVDEVTKGNNWMAFLLKGEQILKKRKNADKRYAVLHIVIVKYRNYCMCHSLEEGQRLLYAISQTIDQNMTPKEELSAHVSSSSFALLMEADSDDSVRQRFDQLLQGLSRTDTHDEQPLMAGHTEKGHTFRFQAGVQIIEPHIIDGKPQKRRIPELERYYNNAVAAKATLEETDDSGIAFFDNRLLEDERWVDLVEECQQKALDNEEYVVYYQPKYSPDEGKLVGAEALIRWQSPDFGFVPPGKFIPIFEKNGFITAIDHYMICHVAADQKKWLDAGMKCVPVSVNVSRAHFAEIDLADQIRNMVDEVGTPHELIEIELTESAFFDDKEALIWTIEHLKKYGFSVSMDDFGSGYSSLNSLKDMNLDVLKLDAEFFRGEADTERKEAVVSEAIRLAKRLNMRIVAEGVEEKEQVEFLDSQGCDMIQGYYFAKPMPKDEFVERMIEVYHMPEES
ncbi:MAG: EAL domain-containing protein [Eubacterium sp.]|nr:EAL domain-containing protein [Eubacterium sp.]